MIEIYKQNPKSFIHSGDCHKTMDAWLEDYKKKVDLIYIDPPPTSGFSFKLIQKVGINQGKITHSKHMREDVDKQGYLPMVRDVLVKGKALLKDTGNIFVHCPPKMSAAFRNLLDQVFGLGGFVNEIIYKFGHGANSQHHFSFYHDNILFYRKSSSSYFNPEPAATARGSERRNHMKKNTGKDGRVYYSIVSDGKEYRYYEDDPVHMGDVWDDLEEDFENSRCRYEGQKPLSLMERIIASACPEGGTVCDPFCGAGTTGAAAAGLGREFLMCDNSRFAVNISKNAIAHLNKPFGVVWGSADILDEKPDTRFSFKGSKVHLEEYRAAGGENYYSNDLLPTEDTLVESWSVGRLLGGKYYVDDFDIRTHESPTLGRYLKLDACEGEPAAFTWDVFGHQTMHKLNIENS